MSENQVEVNWLPLVLSAGILKTKLPEHSIKLLDELTSLIIEDNSFENLNIEKFGTQKLIPIIQDANRSKFIANFLTFSNNLCLEYINTYTQYYPAAKSIWLDTTSAEIYEFWVNKQNVINYSFSNNTYQPFTSLNAIIFLNNSNITFICGDKGNPYNLEFPSMLSTLVEAGDYFIYPSWVKYEINPTEEINSRKTLHWNAKLWV